MFVNRYSVPSSANLKVWRASEKNRNHLGIVQNLFYIIIQFEEILFVVLFLNDFESSIFVLFGFVTLNHV